ncbi:TPA: hypothetical protein MIP74_28020 [Klebsiella pneumoniae]|nr:hypothetical protein [Klebsiella pneumoniae]
MTGSALRPKPAKSKQADRKCFVSTAITVAAHKTPVRAAPRHPANVSRNRIKIRSRSPFLKAVSGCLFFIRFTASGRL